MGPGTRRLAATALAVALVTAGCGGPPGGGDDADTITYWSSWKEGEAQQKVLAQAITDFEAETDITVNVEWQGRSVTQKLVPTLNTNKVPDLVDSGYGKLAPVLAETGQAASMKTLYDSEVEGKSIDKIIPASYRSENTLMQGEPWLMPYGITSDAFWYDTSKHPELTDNPPATWDDFTHLLDVSAKAGRTPMAADADQAGYNSWWFTTLFIRATHAGGFHELAADKTGAGWDSPAALEAAERVEQIIKGGYLLDGYGASKWPAQQQAWSTGKADLLFNGTWIPAETEPYASEDFSYGSFPFPAVDPGKPKAVRADLTGFAIPAKSRHQEDAGKFATFLLRSKYQNAWGTQAKSLPVRTDAKTTEELSSALAALRDADEVYQQNDGVSFPGYMEKVFWPIDDDLFLGKITAKEFVVKVKAAQIAYWKAQE